MRYIGLDLHTNQMTICYLENGEYNYETLTVAEIYMFKKWLLSTDELAIEAMEIVVTFIDTVQI